ncbi:MULTISPECIES: AI-2E family transporter [unclassified Cellulophaga]|uniref:AI-2E family transporter n=1 Tax=unclassified Cellulophaga TaxID=2634405 RepID=UPI0026E1660C|nr:MULTISPECIES: AI-2E family transporter [unclassified Cellulophaga]MDO6492262.1 AI-2E family transporter [Cellulophaga sp. 2_MG-2023]MDO6493212.1 AI-2E family transporter [Cellulophaga sp. 3_MG-2023]
MKYISPHIIRQIFVLMLIVLMGGLIFKEILPYLSGVLGAITIYVILKKPMQKLVNKGWLPNIAAIFLMILSFLCIMIPIAGLGLMMGTKIKYAVDNSQKVIDASKEQLQKVESFFNIDMGTDIDTSSITSWLSENLQNFAGGTFNMVISITIMYFILFFMLTNRRKLKESLFEYIPIKDKNLKTIGKETSANVKANALGIPLVAIGQGVVGLIGFLIFGIEDPFFWAAVVTIGSMIPFVGSALGTIPVFILALSNGDTFQAWGILIYGLVAIGATDNVFRLFILKRLDDVHPLITLVGVLVGVPLFGFIGLIFGPLLVSLFLILVRIYKNQYGESQESL